MWVTCTKNTITARKSYVAAALCLAFVHPRPVSAADDTWDKDGHWRPLLAEGMERLPPSLPWAGDSYRIHRCTKRRTYEWRLWCPLCRSHGARIVAKRLWWRAQHCGWIEPRCCRASGDASRDRSASA